MTIRSQAVGPVLQAVKAAGADEVAFARRFGLPASAATAVLVPRDNEPSDRGVVYVRVDNPHLAFARIAQEFAP